MITHPALVMQGFPWPCCLQLEFHISTNLLVPKMQEFLWSQTWQPAYTCNPLPVTLIRLTKNKAHRRRPCSHLYTETKNKEVKRNTLSNNRQNWAQQSPGSSEYDTLVCFLDLFCLVMAVELKTRYLSLPGKNLSPGCFPSPYFSVGRCCLFPDNWQPLFK